jgi:hypothetical protein
MKLVRVAPRLHTVLGIGLEARSTDFPVPPPYTISANPIRRFIYYTPSSHHITTKSRNINLVSIGSGDSHLLRPD